MQKDGGHILDRELLQNLDGELNSRRASTLKRHLAGCSLCRLRQARLESTLTGFVEFHHENVVVSPVSQSRIQLADRLERLATGLRPVFWQRSLQFAFGMATVVLAAALIHFLIPGVRAASIPNARLTPGVVRAVTRNELCAFPAADDAQPVPSNLAFRVFDKYGIRNPQPRAYEVDFLITPALGGSADVGNLWPEPYADGIWNAHVKDALEDRLHELVCSGTIDLTTAQHDIAANWIDAYKKYFHTDHPLELHAAFSKDRPWE